MEYKNEKIGNIYDIELPNNFSIDSFTKICMKNNAFLEPNGDVIQRVPDIKLEPMESQV